MRTDRLLHYGCGLLALSLLLALVLSGVDDGTDPAALALASWLQSLALLLGAGMVVGHLVVRALTREPSFEEQVSDWFE